MPQRPRLLQAPPVGRFTFVVGKGGVGKSTTAAAIALGWAESNHAIHLLSTDPASSVADVFGARTLADALHTATPSSCTPRLLLEELDAQRITDDWLQRVRAPLEQLMVQGTYLDAEDVTRLTHLTLPGVDEIAAALRIAELACGDRHVVVDTAPTGHTLRLLDTPQLIESWAAVFRAMSDKVATIALTMVGARFRMPGENVVDELRSVAAVLRTALADASFVVVTREGAVVAAETQRLIAELHARRLRVAAIVHVGSFKRSTAPSGDGPAMIQAPRLVETSGCDALRLWVATATAFTAEGAESAESADTVSLETPLSDPSRSDPSLSALDWVDSLAQRMLWFAGKGGVGKSTCAAAVALRLSSTRRVLLCSTDPAGSQKDVLSLQVAPDGRMVRPNLRVQQVDAAAELRTWKARYRAAVDNIFDQLGVGGTATFDRDIMTALWDAVPPGIDELFSLSDLLDAAGTDETVVIDSAPTGHFLRLIQSPEVALEWSHAIMRILIKYGVAGELEGFAERMLAFSKQLKELRATLVDASVCGVIIVTLEEPVVEAETLRLESTLAGDGIHVLARIVNRASGCANGANRSRAGAQTALDSASVRRSVSTVTILRAPALTVPPVGLTGVEAFLAQWELA
ncbi:MAG: ArsA-related P-loop ATPase [Longimicrobiales bacterium]